jgi:hypothetical protein
MATLTEPQTKRAHEDAVSLAINDVVKRLQQALGTKLVAYLAGVSDPKAVGDWAGGTRPPRRGAEERLRTALHVFRLLEEADSVHVARAWFIGLNPQLDDEAPASALREGRQRDVLRAARSFAQSG